MAAYRRKHDHPAYLSCKRWRAVRARVLDRDGWRCVQCGKAGRLEVDHVVPVGKGGSAWDEANLQTLCRAHHFAKTKGENETPDAGRDAWRALVAARVMV